MPPVRNPKEFGSGLLFALFGIAAIAVGASYPVGTAARMGPGYFPRALGLILLAIGAVLIFRGLRTQGARLSIPTLKPLAIVLGSVVLFGVLVRGAGLVPSLILLVLVSAWASEKFQIKSAVLLAILTSVFSALVFVKGLGLPFSIIGPWFGK